MQIQRVRVLKLSAIFFVITFLFSWRSVAAWDWRHIENLSGAVNVLFHLGSLACAALFFGLLFELSYFGWLMPKFLQRRSQGQSRS